MESVGQRALKFLAVKVGGLKKKSTVLAFTTKECASTFGPDLSSPGSIFKVRLPVTLT